MVVVQSVDESWLIVLDASHGRMATFLATHEVRFRRLKRVVLRLLCMNAQSVGWMMVIDCVEQDGLPGCLRQAF